MTSIICRSAPVLGAIALALGVWLVPGQAEAKDEFETAFKYELGRIAAHEAAGVGRHLLADILFGGVRHGPQPHVYRRHHDHDHYDNHDRYRDRYRDRYHHRYHDHHRKHWHKRHRYAHGHRRHHHDRGCDY